MNLTIVVYHTLGVDVAVTRIKAHVNQLLEALGEKISNVETEWVGTALSYRFDTAAGQVSGTLAVGENEVIVDVTTPLIAWFVRNKIKRRIREELSTCLE